jgi:hypothetical protein
MVTPSKELAGARPGEGVGSVTRQINRLSAADTC